jgi:hypothetical protein
LEFKPLAGGRPLPIDHTDDLSDADKRVLKAGGKVVFERVGDSVTKHIEQPNARQRQKADLMAIKKRWSI